MGLKSKIKFALSLLLFISLLLYLPIADVAETLSNFSIGAFALTAFFTLLIYFVRVFKWRLFLKAVGVKVSFLSTLKAYLIAMFYGAVTPAHAGEFMRAYYLKQKKSLTLPTVLLDKIVDLFSLIFLSILSVVFFFRDSTLILIVGGVVILFLIATTFIMKQTVLRFVLCTLLRKSEKTADNFIVVLKRLTAKKHILLASFVLSLFSYLLLILAAAVIVISLNPTVNPLVVSAIPILFLVSNIPITIGGFGLREVTGTLLFKLWNETAVLGFSTTMLLSFIAAYIPAIIGYILTLFEKEDIK